MERIADPNAITQPVEVPRLRPTPAANATALSNGARASGASETVPVSPQRRSVGLLIAVGLLALLVLGATYFAVKVTR